VDEKVVRAGEQEERQAISACSASRTSWRKQRALQSAIVDRAGSRRVVRERERRRVDVLRTNFSMRTTARWCACVLA
jgi:hypothetical protein